MLRIAAAFAVASLARAALPAQAEYLAPNWSGLQIEGVGEPEWFAGVREGKFIGMCMQCDGTMMLEVQVVPDDGTGERVRSGVTTAETYTEIGQANAAALDGDANYFGTEDIRFAQGVGFRTLARAATGDYSATYQLWSDDQQLIVRVFGADQSAVESLAQTVFDSAAPLTFR